MSISIAVPKGRLFEDTINVFLKAGVIEEPLKEDSRKLIIEEGKSGIKFLLVRAKDVITYVFEGAADLGVVGYDLLVEENPDVFHLLDLGFGYCKLVIAGKKGTDLNNTSIRVATKFPNIARSYFRSKEIEPEIIELYGSIELGPLVGLSDCIVDITSTGKTLEENNLVILDDIIEATSRLISNKKSFYFKREEISTVVEKIVRSLNNSM
jgi:ATP phosphoribosyltransferase